MAGSDQLLTLEEILEKLRKDEYSLNKRTFHYYVNTGLLPKATRVGSKKGGVKFYYPATTPNRIKQIFEFKSRGFKLEDIKNRMSEEGPDAESISTATTDDFRGTTIIGTSLPPVNAETDINGGPKSDLFEKVMALTPDGDRLKLCIQCGTCGGSCPSAGDMDHTPRHLFAMLQAGFDDTVLRSSTPWYCVSCYHCTVRCPQQIPITDIMYTLKQLAINEGVQFITEAYDFARAFVHLVQKYGKSFDYGLASRYHLTHNNKSRMSWGSLAIRMFKKERVITGGSRIDSIKELARILSKAKNLEGMP